MLYIQLPYGYLENNKQVQFNLPNNYEESLYRKEVLHLTNKKPSIETNLLHLIRNRDDLKKWFLATGRYGNEIQEDLNAIVGYGEKFNNAIVRHSKKKSNNNNNEKFANQQVEQRQRNFKFTKRNC